MHCEQNYPKQLERKLIGSCRDRSRTQARADGCTGAYFIGDHRLRSKRNPEYCQGKRLATAATKMCRELRDRGRTGQGKASSSDKQVREFGLVCLFRKGEKVNRLFTRRQWIIISVCAVWAG